MSAARQRAGYAFEPGPAIVTGGSRGIGAAIAQRLRADGVTVVWDAVPNDADPTARAVDITDAKQLAAALTEVMRQHGAPAMLVNNAGFAGPTVPLLDYDPAVWQRIIDVNLNGTFHVCQAVAAAMRDAGRGRIVNIASLAGKEGTPNASAYSAAKAGVIALTKSLGKELASSGVLVNAIAPAAVRSDLLAQMSPAHVQTMLDKSPMGRLGEPEEVAEMAAWLLSTSCTFSTGAVFDLSGGRATY